MCEWGDVREHHHASAMQHCVTASEWSQSHSMTQWGDPGMLLCCEALCWTSDGCATWGTTLSISLSSNIFSVFRYCNACKSHMVKYCGIWHISFYVTSDGRYVKFLFSTMCIFVPCQCSHQIRSVKFNHDPRLVPQKARSPSPCRHPAQQLWPARADLHWQHDCSGDRCLPAGSHWWGWGPDVGHCWSGWHEK